jgi:hypothetical protein
MVRNLKHAIALLANPRRRNGKATPRNTARNLRIIRMAYALHGGRISKSWLRKDRVGKQIFPFYRVGRLCFYDLDEIEAVFQKNRFGGKAAA